jgi:hypothetical protein
VFDVSKRIAAHASEALAPSDNDSRTSSWRPLSGAGRIVQSLILVGGGVIGGIGHEIVGRPFDTARRVLHINEAHTRTEHIKASILSSHSESISSLSHRQTFWPKVATAIRILRDTTRNEGWLYFFRSTTPTSFDPKSSPYQKLHTALRTLGRVGPWGVAFLVWEATGGTNM